VRSQLPGPLESVLHELPEIKVRQQSERRVRVDLGADVLPTLLELLKGRAGYLHLSTISCVDWPQSSEFELVYHVWSYETKALLSAHVRIPTDPGRYVSVYDIFTPAAFYERDIHEMFGVYFEGSPDMGKFILTEWQGPPPMRKSFSSIGYVEDTFEWREYGPEWLREVQEKGGGMVS
jgi:NADH-quinone oxidoreductase subunit C